MRGKLGALTPQQEEAIEALTRGIVNKIAHGPSRSSASMPAARTGRLCIDIIRKVFRLGAVNDRDRLARIAARACGRRMG